MKLSIEELQQLLPDAKLDRRGRNLYATCPSCNQNEFGISIEDNHRFGCFRKAQCGFAGNIFTLLAFLGKSIYDVKPSFTPRTHIDVDKLLIHEQQPVDLQIANCMMPLGFRKISHHPYLETRGFTISDYDKYNVGITSLVPKYKDFLIFGIKQFGEIKATLARSQKNKKEIDQLNTYYKSIGSKEKAYRYINGTQDFAKILLGVEELTEKTRTVIIVEGLFDKVNTDKQLELPFDHEIKCCATFKCGVSAEQMYLLQQSGVSDVILLYDPDVPHEIAKAAWALDPYFNVRIAFNEEGKDPGDMNQEEFIGTLMEQCSPSQFNKISVPTLRKK